MIGGKSHFKSAERRHAFDLKDVTDLSEFTDV